ncbi:MAG: hypothetical protein KBD63_08160, partial [Bacteriovoracaceae bacterium]|nr:hypothetical protein [Bacteriovoracaceae bacterium]
MLFLFLNILAGSFYALGFPSPLAESLFPLPLLGICILLFNFFKANFNLKKCIYSFLFFTLGFNLTGYYWLTETLVTFGNLPYAIGGTLALLFSQIIA